MDEDEALAWVAGAQAARLRKRREKTQENNLYWSSQGQKQKEVLDEVGPEDIHRSSLSNCLFFFFLWFIFVLFFSLFFFCFIFLFCFCFSSLSASLYSVRILFQFLHHLPDPCVVALLHQIVLFVLLRLAKPTLILFFMLILNNTTLKIHHKKKRNYIRIREKGKQVRVGIRKLTIRIISI